MKSHLKITTILISLLSIYVESFCHVDLHIKEKHGNVYLNYVTGFREYEYGNHARIVAKLVNEFINEHYTDNRIPVVLTLIHDYAYYKNNLKHIQYDTAQLDYFQKEYMKENWIALVDSGKKDLSLVIYLEDTYPSSTECLKLVDYGLSNIAYIQRSQKLAIDTVQESILHTFISIPRKIIDSLLMQENKKIESFIKQKIYRLPDSLLNKNEVSYYYQNDKFHFYFNQPNRFTEIPFMQINSVWQIIEFYSNPERHKAYNYTFVFENDSTFFICDSRNKNFSEKISFSSHKPYDLWPNEVLDAYEIQNPHILCIRLNNGRKILWELEKNIVVQNYDDLELDLMKNLLYKPDSPKHSKKDNKISSIAGNVSLLKLFIALVCILFSLMIIYTLSTNTTKNK